MTPTDQQLTDWLNSIPVEALMEFVNRRVEGDKKADYIRKIMADPESKVMAAWSWEIDYRHNVVRIPTQYGRNQ